jgi:hypothetical protein
MIFRQFILKLLKKIVRSLPVSLSNRLVSLYSRLLNYRFIRVSLVNARIKEIQDTLLKLKPVYLVYDNFCSPPTYGDFMHVVFLARYIRARGVKPIVFIITGEYRNDWDVIHDQGKTEWFVSEQESVARFLLGNHEDIRVINWQSFTSQLHEKGEGSTLLFSNEVILRKPIYGLCFNALNVLFEKKVEKTHLDLTLLREKDMVEKTSNGVSFFLKNPPADYVSLVCRRNPFWAPERNLSDESFLFLVESIIRSFPGSRIVCVSDHFGCDYFRALAGRFYPQLDEVILFSKDFSSTFLGDCLIALKSKALIQLAGGGITTPVLFSATPYLVMFDPGYALSYRKDKLTSWATDRQIFVGKPSFEMRMFKRFVAVLDG